MFSSSVALATFRVLSIHMWLVAATLVQTENISIIAENTGQWRSLAGAMQQISVESYCNASSDIPHSKVLVGPRGPHF